MVRNAAHLLGAQIATAALSFLTTALLARHLGAGQFGVLFTSAALVNMAFIFVEWGTDAYVVQAVARERGMAEEFLGTGLAFRVCLAAVLSLPVMASSWMLGYSKVTRLATALTLAMMTLTSLANPFSSVFKGLERMSHEAVARIAGAILGTVAVLLAVATGSGVLQLLVWQSAAAAGAIPIMVCLGRRLGVKRPVVNRKTAHLLLRSGSPFLLFNLMIAVQAHFGTIIISKMVPESIVGSYGAASRFAGLLIFPVTILGSALYPTLSRLAATSLSDYRHMVRAGFRPMLMLAFPVALGTYLLSDWAIALVYGGRGFGPAGANLRVWSVVVFLLFLTMPLGYAVLAIGRQIPFAYAKGICAAIYFLSSFTLIPFFQARFGNGGLGAAAATAVSELAMLASAIRLLPAGTLNYAILRDGARFAGAGVGMAVVAVSMKNLSAGLGVFLGGLVYLLLLLAFRGLRLQDLSLFAEAFPLRRRIVPDASRSV